MKKVLLWLSGIIIMLLASIGVYLYYPVDYIPVILVVYRGNHSLEYAPMMLSESHYDAVKNILDQYGEWNYRTKNGLKIRWRLLRDKNLLQNYTNKACAREKN